MCLYFFHFCVPPPIPPDLGRPLWMFPWVSTFGWHNGSGKHIGSVHCHIGFWVGTMGGHNASGKAYWASSLPYGVSTLGHRKFLGPVHCNIVSAHWVSTLPHGGQHIAQCVVVKVIGLKVIDASTQHNHFKD